MTYRDKDLLPSVAVCIPTYNQADYLSLAVESALAQDYAGPLSVVVADDASTDATPTVLTDLLRRFSNLRVISKECNAGIAANASRALRSAQADFVVRLDHDDLLLPAYVGEMVSALQAHRDAAYAHSAIQEIDGGGCQSRVRRVWKVGFQAGEDALRDSLNGLRTAANVVTFRKSALDHVGYFDTAPDFTADYYLAVKLHAAGYGSVYLDKVLACYRVWSDEHGHRQRRKAQELAGLIRVFDEALGPAWCEREWRQAELRRQRRYLAVHHCPSCFRAHVAPAERTALVQLLIELGDGPRLRLRLALCRVGARRLLETIDAAPGRLKSVLKTLRARVYGRSWPTGTAAATASSGLDPVSGRSIEARDLRLR